MTDTLGLLEESRNLAHHLGYEICEEPLGELPGGSCHVAGRARIMLNIAHAPAEQLDVLIGALARDIRTQNETKSHLLEQRFAQVARYS
ncbi:MAG: hypothetical protein ABGW78_15120 [Pirellulales bacterium]